MTFPSDFKAISLGALVYIVGYGACLLFGTLFPHEPYTPIWLLSVGFVLLVPVASGAFAARLATSNPLGHGTAVGLLGTAISLAVLIFGAGISISPFTAATWLVAAASLAWLGAFVLGRRRLGL